MTEAERWLEIAEECVMWGERGCVVFLCIEIKVEKALAPTMLERLMLFAPVGLSAEQVWWNFGDDPTDYVDQEELNNQRALACCFLAVMAERGESVPILSGLERGK